MDVYTTRLEKVYERMDAEGVDILLSTRPENIYYLTNYQTAGDPVQILILCRNTAHIITREMEMTNAVYRSFASYSCYTESDDPLYIISKYITDNFQYATVGYEGNSKRFSPQDQEQLHDMLTLNNTNTIFKDCSTLISSLRLIKSDLEIEHAKCAAHFVEQGIEKVLTMVRPGMSETEIAGIIDCKMQELGCEYTAYPRFVSAGWTGCMGHYAAEHKILEENEILFLEIGASYNRYHAARMHTVYVGNEPPQWFTDAERLIRRAIREAKKIMKPGVNAYIVDELMRGIINEYQFPYTQSERSGYSIGIGFYTDWAENDVFQIYPTSKAILQRGMIIHLIPWIQLPDIGAIGFSDTVLVTEHCAESLFTKISSSEYCYTVKSIFSEPCTENKDCRELLEYTNQNMDHPKITPTDLVIRDEPGIFKLAIKDESTRMGLKAFKVLGVNRAVEKLEQRGGINKGDTVTTMTDGNHGSAVAFVAKQKGYKAIIFVPGNMTDERRKTIESFGAECRVVDGGYDDCIEKVKNQALENGWVLISDTAWDGYEDIPKDIAVGYTTIFHEIDTTLGDFRPTHIFLQAGVGGFASAGVAYSVLKMNPRPKLVCVEPTDADCIFENVRINSDGTTMCNGNTDSIMSGLNCGTPSSTAWPILRDYVDAYLAIGDSWAREAVKRLYHNPDRILAGESGAAGYAGFLACMNNTKLKKTLCLDENSIVVVINTEGVTDTASFNEIIGYNYF